MSSPPPRRGRLECESIGDVVVVNFVDKKILDEPMQWFGEDGLYRLVDELGWRKVLVNFGNLEFVSSAILGKLITAERKLQAVQGKMVLCNIVPDILDLFRITSVNRIFTIVTNPALVSIEEIINEAFGNPFRAAFSANWRTSTAIAIARGIDESRDLGVLPILADALQDAGCDNEEILSVCRAFPLSLAEPSERDAQDLRVCGCWVVDLVLGK